MLGGHLYELVIVLIIALVVFGPKRLPELGGSLGKGIREFRKATTELQDTIKTDVAEPLPPQAHTYTASDYAAPQQTTAHTTAEFTAAPRATTPTAAEHVASPVESAPVRPVDHEAPRV